VPQRVWAPSAAMKGRPSSRRAPWRDPGLHLSARGFALVRPKVVTLRVHRSATGDHGITASRAQTIVGTRRSARTRRGVAGLAHRRDRKPGDHDRRPRRTERQQGLAAERAGDAQPAGAPHPRRAAAKGRPDDARGGVASIRNLARAGAAGRDARLRAKGNEGADRGGADSKFCLKNSLAHRPNAGP
jgi:hypothetical protein